MDKEQQIKNLEEAQDLMRKAWGLIYRCDRSVGMDSPFEPVRMALNSLTVDVNKLAESLEKESK